MWLDEWPARLLAGLCSLGALVLALLQIMSHLKHYNEPTFQRYIVRILFMIPVYAVCSFLSLMFIDQAVYIESARDCYEAWVIYNFLSLCLAYVGGAGAVEVKMNGYTLLPSCFHCTCCLAPLPVNGHFVRRTKQGTLQFVFLKPILALITVCTYATEHYTPGNWAPNNAYLWVQILYNITYTTALYSILLFYLGTHSLLLPFKPLLKFILIKSVIFLTFWQGLLISILTSIGKTAASEGSDLQNFLICVEMFPAAVLLWFAFPYAEYKVEGQGSSGITGNVTHAISIRDVVSDTVHQFAPSYQEYVLYSDGGVSKVTKSGKAAPKGAKPPPVKDDANLLANMELGAAAAWQSESTSPTGAATTEDADMDAPVDIHGKYLKKETSMVEEAPQGEAEGSAAQPGGTPGKAVSNKNWMDVELDEK